jgi:adenine/guanine phosphoribosyltransferase-like PRPP-binding protein
MTRKNGSAIFSTKKIPVPIRKYFDPVMWNGLICSNSHRLLLVDDLLASGGTFSSARCLLMDQGWPAPQHAITWFSAV